MDNHYYKIYDKIENYYPNLHHKFLLKEQHSNTKEEDLEIETSIYKNKDLLLSKKTVNLDNYHQLLLS